jgi:NADH-quinone oxidoreductase subunit M
MDGNWYNAINGLFYFLRFFFMPKLLWFFVIPFLSSLLVLLSPFSGKKLKFLAVFLAFLPLAMLILDYSNWIGTNIDYLWFSSLSIHFRLSVDTLTLLFLFLVAIIIPLSLLVVVPENTPSSNVLYSLVLVLEGLLIGFFTARDLAVFTLFWEAMILPLYFIILIWGGSKRESSAFKFLIYMIGGSSLMVVAVLSLYFTSSSESINRTFDIETLTKVASTAPYTKWIFAIFILAFAVKTPLFPFHAWLPDAYSQASTTGTILLSAILSKAGIYGIIRIGMGFFPSLIIDWSPFLLGLAITGVFYGGLSAWRQSDYKRLIAYSSFSHVNFILAGLFIWNQTSHAGAILQSLNHGITIAALFLTAGWLEQRIETTSINQFSGLAKYLPNLCWLTLFFVVSNVAVPATNNFIGELMILLGLFQENPWLAGLLGLSIILSVIYMLRWMQKVYFGTPPIFLNISWIDIQWKQFAIALPLVALILWVGIYPTPILKIIAPASENIAAVAILEDV